MATTKKDNIADLGNRIVGLDILRSIAILKVVYIHGAFFLPPSITTSYSSVDPTRAIDGVSIFFVLSGFLIGTILLKTISQTNFTSKDLFHFWVRRWFRTIPNYLLVLVGLLLYQMIIFGDTGSFSFKYFIFSQNLFNQHPESFPEAWSLTIEEWFYLLFPILCFILIRVLKDKEKSVLISAVVFLILPLVLRIIKYNSGAVDDIDEQLRKIVVLRLDSLMYGVIGAYISFQRPEFWNRLKYPTLAIGIVAVALLYFFPAAIGFYPPLLFNFESIVTFCFLPFLSLLPTTRIKWVDSFFVFISTISYSMYLLNYSVVQVKLLSIINKRMPGLTGNDLITFDYVIYWLLTIGGAYLLYRFYESRMTKLRERFE